MSSTDFDINVEKFMVKRCVEWVLFTAIYYKFKSGQLRNATWVSNRRLIFQHQTHVRSAPAIFELSVLITVGEKKFQPFCIWHRKQLAGWTKNYASDFLSCEQSDPTQLCTAQSGQLCRPKRRQNHRKKIANKMLVNKVCSFL